MGQRSLLIIGLVLLAMSVEQGSSFEMASSIQRILRTIASRLLGPPENTHTRVTRRVGLSARSVDNNALLKDDHGRIRMGTKQSGCDDGKTDLAVDWNGSPELYTCYNPTRPILPDESRESTLHCDNIPFNYIPSHFCMRDKLEYVDPLPTHGDHRPLWGKFGEYRYIPPQRWLHNIEHGSVIMLYHPCAHHSMVRGLKRIVQDCIRKHIITPSHNLDPKQPLALIAWGCRLSMSHLDVQAAVNFIKNHGLKGPEGELAKEGQYEFAFLEAAKVVNGSDYNDSNLCPGL